MREERLVQLMEIEAEIRADMEGVTRNLDSITAQLIGGNVSEEEGNSLMEDLINYEALLDMHVEQLRSVEMGIVEIMMSPDSEEGYEWIN